MDYRLLLMPIFTFLISSVTSKYGPLPDEPFHVIWQIPSIGCQSPEINITFTDILQDSGVLWNKDDLFEGEYSMIMYRAVYGAWPHYLHGEEPAINDGLPQLGNLTRHLQRIEDAIEAAIPERDFHGVACINMEQFRPLWERNWGDKNVYRKKSRELIAEKFAHLDPTDEWIESEAERVFSYHAKKFMTEALRLSRKLRPNGKWGFYHFPYCYNNKPITLHCRDTVQYGNDKMKWMWEESTGIFPSVYVFREWWSYYDTAKYMYANIEEGIRVGNLVGGRPTFVYHKNMWNMTLPVLYYPKIIMLMGMRLSADFGTEGVVLWGSQGHYKTKFDCERGHQYAKETIIPYAKSLQQFTRVCAESRCSNRGRCVHRGALDDRYADEMLRTTFESLTDWSIDNYKCRCAPGHSGEDCSKSVSSAGGLGVNVMLLVICLVITHRY